MNNQSKHVFFLELLRLIFRLLILALHIPFKSLVLNNGRQVIMWLHRLTRFPYDFVKSEVILIFYSPFSMASHGLGRLHKEKVTHHTPLAPRSHLSISMLKCVSYLMYASGEQNMAFQHENWDKELEGVSGNWLFLCCPAFNLAIRLQTNFFCLEQGLGKSILP